MPSHRLAIALALLLALPAAVRAEEARLTILHTTDLHGSLTGWDDLADRPAARGLTRVATLVRRVRAEGGPVLLLDAGDAIQGSPLETVWHRGFSNGHEPMMSAMGALGYDAMAVGNHEFGYGLGALTRARTEAGFPWLAANIVRADGAPAFAASLVKTVGALRVGIVGVCTQAVPALEDSANYEGLRFLPAVEAAKAEVARLRAGGLCDVVVLLAHTGLEFDPRTGTERLGGAPDENVGRALALDVPGVDVLILGHTHAVVDSLTLGTTLVTQAGRWADHLGRVDLAFSRAAANDPWTLASRRAAVFAVTDSVPEDTALAALAEPYHQATRAALAETLGFARVEIGAPGGRLEDGRLWELIQKVQLEATDADVSLASLFDPAARIAAGPITLRDAMAIYPYDNTLGVVTLTGAELKEALEQSARYLAPYTFEDEHPLFEPGVPTYDFDAAEGVTYDIDLTRPAGDRVINLAFAGHALEPDHALKVAVNSYRMNGGGGVEVIRRAPRVSVTARGVRDLLVDYLRRAHTLDGAFTRNWSVLPDYAASPQRASIDLLVRQGALPRAEAMRLYPGDPVRRGDLAYWLARAFGWRERRLSGAFGDVPDSLEPWLDGLIRRHALGPSQAGDHFDPFRTLPLGLALDWCEGTARSAGYPLPMRGGDPSFRRGLLTGIDSGHVVPGAAAFPETLTREQALAMVANLRYPTVRVLETTDFHGFIMPGKERRTNRPIGGSVALAAWLTKLRAENPEGTVLIDGGDLFQGTMISNLPFGRPIVEQMNALGYTASAIGNHEFDWTADTLERRVHEMHFAALGANLVLAKTHQRPRWVRADTVVTRRGVRIGILGLCYPQTPSVTLAKNVTHLRFEDDSATAAKLVPVLRRQDHADVVVGVGHIPAETDSAGHARGDLPRLARGVPGVDVWFGGHSHNRVRDEVKGVPIMIAGAHGEVVGVCDLRVDPVAHRVIDRHYRLETTYGDAVPPDTAMQARVARWNAGVGAIAAQPLGRNASLLGRARGGESTLGDLVADAMREATGADIAFQNSGGLRADLGEGVVTRGSIYEVMPFDNTMVTMELTGAEVRKALEDGLRGGRVTQVSGVRFSFDASRPEMQRVVTLQDGAGAPLDSTRTWKVVVNNFMAGGGDDYFTLAHGKNTRDTQQLVRDALEGFVRTRCAGGKALDYKVEGRVTRLGGGASRE